MITTQNYQIVRMVQPQAIVNNASFTCAALDTIDFAGALILFDLGATDIAYTALKLQECATSGGSYTDVVGGDFSTATHLPGATDDNNYWAWDIQQLGSHKRFFKVVATVGNGSAGSYATITGILSRGGQVPHNDTERGLKYSLQV